MHCTCAYERVQEKDTGDFVMATAKRKGAAASQIAAMILYTLIMKFSGLSTHTRHTREHSAHKHWSAHNRDYGIDRNFRRTTNCISVFMVVTVHASISQLFMVAASGWCVVSPWQGAWAEGLYTRLW